jgi:hypothetical protein
VLDGKNTLRFFIWYLWSSRYYAHVYLQYQYIHCHDNMLFLFWSGVQEKQITSITSSCEPFSIAKGYSSYISPSKWSIVIIQEMPISTYGGQNRNNNGILSIPFFCRLWSWTGFRKDFIRTVLMGISFCPCFFAIFSGRMDSLPVCCWISNRRCAFVRCKRKNSVILLSSIKIRIFSNV